VVAPLTGVLNELPDPDSTVMRILPEEARMGVCETSSAELKGLLRPPACVGPRRRQGRSSGGALHLDPRLRSVAPQQLREGGGNRDL
jgi:hypothetical protein